MRHNRIEDVIILRWHDAVNARDTSAALAVTTPDVAIGGPRGQVTGQEVLLEWIQHAGIRLVPLSVEWRGNRAVVAQDATWPDNPDADRYAAPIRVYTVFTMDNGVISGVFRFDSIEDLEACFAQ